MRRLAVLLSLAGLAGLTARPAAAQAVGGDPVRGQRLYLQCRACHSVGPNDPSGTGPNLWGVAGAKAAAKPGYHYSAALKASGLVWTADKLDAWLTRPTALVPGTTMAFAGMAAPAARRDVIAYLATLSAKMP